MGFSLKKMFSGSGWRKFKGTVGGVLSIATSVVPGVGGLAGKLLTSKLGRAGAKGVKFYRSTAAVLRASPVMPGGGIATPGGVVGASSPVPPAVFGGGGGGGMRRTARRKKRTVGATRRHRKRKLKFGSPAWRKKYMKKRRRR